MPAEYSCERSEREGRKMNKMENLGMKRLGVRRITVGARMTKHKCSMGYPVS